MSKGHLPQQNGSVPGGGGGDGPDDFSDDDSTPLTQDYGGRYVHNIIYTITRSLVL